MDDVPPELLAIVPCVADFLDVDGSELLAVASISSDISCESSLISTLLLNSSTDSNSNSARENNCTDSQHVSFVSVASLSDFEFQQAFRMHRPTFDKLLSTLREHKSESKQKIKMMKNSDPSLECNILMALHYLGSQKNVKEISEMFQAKESGVLNSISTTISSLYDLIKHFISWPTNSEKERITEGFGSICKLSNVLGVIGMTHLQCKHCSRTSNNFYVNASGTPSIILQAVCDHEMRFLHCCTGWPGTFDCTSVLHDSDIFQDLVKDCSPYFLEDSVLIGDKDYPSCTWLITPFAKETGHLSDQETHFNFCHGLALNTISKTFFHLKRRFPRLNCLDTNNIEYLVKTVLVCCALHNLCISQEKNTLFKELIKPDKSTK